MIPNAVAEQERRATELMQAAATATPQGTQDDGNQDTDQNTYPQGQPQSQPPQRQVAPQETVEYWRDRFSVLQGKYNAEVPDLAARLRTLEADLAEAKRKPPEPVRLLTEDDVNNFGPEQVEIARKIVREVQSEEIQQLQDEIAQLKAGQSQLSNNVSVNSRTGYLDALDRRFGPQKGEDKPYWRVVNERPDFLAWLGEMDPVAGRTRMDGLKEADAQCDVERVSAIFNTFLGGSSAPRVTPQAAAPNARINPPTSVRRSADQDGQSGVQSWTRAQVSAFNADKFQAQVHNRGPLADKPEEIARIDAEINAALRANRIFD